MREVGAGGGEKNHAIKRFRNRAISNHDFISISINRTALNQIKTIEVGVRMFGLHLWCYILISIKPLLANKIKSLFIIIHLIKTKYNLKHPAKELVHVRK